MGNWLAKERYPDARIQRDLDSSLYFIVHILPTHEAMMARHLQLQGRREPPKYAPTHSDKLDAKHREKYVRVGAYVMPRRVIPIKPTKMSAEKFALYERMSTRLLGFALFYRGAVDTETICHECVHIAIEYHRRIRCSLKISNTECDDNEEGIAYTIGLVIKQMTNLLHAHGVWK